MEFAMFDEVIKRLLSIFFGFCIVILEMEADQQFQ